MTSRRLKRAFDVTVESLCVSLFAIPWSIAHQAPLSSTIFWSLLKFMSIESLMPSNHLILCRPTLLLPSIFPSIRVFSNESVLCIMRWPKYWSFSFSIIPSKETPGLVSFSCMSFFLGSRMIYVAVCRPDSYCFDYCSFVTWSEVKAALKGETVPDSRPATPKSPPTRRVPPRGTTPRSLSPLERNIRS